MCTSTLTGGGKDSSWSILAACPPASTTKPPALPIFSAQLHRPTSATAFCSRCSHPCCASKLKSALLRVLWHPTAMMHSNLISVQSMPRSPELRNLLDRTICTGPEPTYSCAQEHKCAYQRIKRHTTWCLGGCCPCKPAWSCMCHGSRCMCALAGAWGRPLWEGRYQ